MRRVQFFENGQVFIIFDPVTDIGEPGRGQHRTVPVRIKKIAVPIAPAAKIGGCSGTGAGDIDALLRPIDSVRGRCGRTVQCPRTVGGVIPNPLRPLFECLPAQNSASRTRQVKHRRRISINPVKTDFATVFGNIPDIFLRLHPHEPYIHQIGGDIHFPPDVTDPQPRIIFFQPRANLSRLGKPPDHGLFGLMHDLIESIDHCNLPCLFFFENRTVIVDEFFDFRQIFFVEFMWIFPEAVIQIPDIQNIHSAFHAMLNVVRMRRILIPPLAARALSIDIHTGGAEPVVKHGVIALAPDGRVGGRIAPIEKSQQFSPFRQGKVEYLYFIRITCRHPALGGKADFALVKPLLAPGRYLYGNPIRLQAPGQIQFLIMHQNIGPEPGTAGVVGETLLDFDISDRIDCNIGSGDLGAIRRLQWSGRHFNSL